MSKYNGWANRETWLINIWMGDDLCEWLLPTEGTSSTETADQIEELVRSMLEESGITDMWLDFINIERIDWTELAEHYIENYS